MAVKVAEEWLNIYGGCEISILDIGDELLDLLPHLDFVHMPVLMDNCAGITIEEGEEKVPRCIKGYMNCRGCFGLVKEGSNPMVDMMSAISSIGLDAKQVTDRRAMLSRYIGPEGRLRPLPQRRA